MPADPVPKSLGARRLVEESTAVTDGLGGGERLATSVDKLAVTPGVTVGAAGSSEAEAGVADAVPESAANKPVMPEEQMSLP